ncbi:MAG: hypothetical protein WDW36_009572 [Sanguina aurantia]
MPDQVKAAYRKSAQAQLVWAHHDRVQPSLARHTLRLAVQNRASGMSAASAPHMHTESAEPGCSQGPLDAPNPASLSPARLMCVCVSVRTLASWALVPGFTHACLAPSEEDSLSGSSTHTHTCVSVCPRPAQTLHPDKFIGSSPEERQRAEATFQKLQVSVQQRAETPRRVCDTSDAAGDKAYSVLRDADSKRLYDAGKILEEFLV